MPLFWGKGDSSMDHDNDGLEQEEIASELEDMLPGYHNHVYKSATSGNLEPAPKKLPTCSSEGCDKSDDGCS